MTRHVELRLPEELLAKIDARAKKVKLSRNAWLVRALEWAVSQPITTHTVEERV